jgi:protein TonB
VALSCFAIMNGSSNGRILRIAIASSLAIHLVIASVVHSSKVAASPEAKVGHAQIIYVKPPKPTPTPPPPQKLPPAKPQHSARVVRPPMHLVQQHSNKNPNTNASQNPPQIEPTGIPNGGYNFDTPGPQVTGAPTPTPTPKPACSAPDIPAKAVEAISPQAPPDAQSSNAVAKIKVDLDASGNVVGTSVYESTGYPQLDRAALDAARESRYAPEEKNCKNMPGSYLFTVTFQE